jgi:hypothetical protein
MPRPNLRHVQPLVRAHCTEHDVSYTQKSLWQSYGIVVRYLNAVGLGARDPSPAPWYADTATNSTTHASSRAPTGQRRSRLQRSEGSSP